MSRPFGWRKSRWPRYIRGRPTTLYSRWNRIKQRCLDPKCEDYPHYGGRGIAMCVAWISDFDMFCDAVGEPPFEGATLERDNNSKGYEPGNVRWASRSEQVRNTRHTVLDIELVAEIRRLRAAGVGASKIARTMQLSRSTVGNVLYGNAWQ